MHSRNAIIICIIFLLTYFFGLTDSVLPTQSLAIIRVPQDYLTITQAIDASHPGDTIVVSEGTYTEGGILVNKPNLTLIADGNVMVDGLKEDDVFTISADYVVLKGFVVKRSYIGGFHSGICLSNVHGCAIENNVVQKNGGGITLWGGNNNTVANNFIIQNWGTGLRLHSSHTNTIINNTLINNRSSGVFLSSCKGNSLIFNKVTSNNLSGIEVSNCYGTILIGNKADSNYYNGLSLGSTRCFLRNNTMNRNLRSNFAISGMELSKYIHDIDSSNLVDGKEVIYILNQACVTINSVLYPLAGFVGVANSTNIIVENLSLANNSNGVLFAYVTNSVIQNVTTYRCTEGIYIFESSNITVRECTAERGWEGITTLCSNNLILRRNVLVKNGYGIHLDSTNSQIIYNTLTNNSNGGIFLRNSNNTVVGNIITNNTKETFPTGGIILDCGDNNIITRNIIKSNLVGVWMWIWVTNNRFFHNNFLNNEQQVGEYMSGQSFWDDGYPSGGNYWSDYEGSDQDGDGIGDESYIVYGDVEDHFPLMKMINPLPGDVNWDGEVDIKDIIESISIYGTTEGNIDWNPFADLAPSWGVIDIFDLVTIAYHYGEVYTL